MKLPAVLTRRLRAPVEEEEEEILCPPHDFTASWGSPAGRDVPEPEAVPVIFCVACGDIRPLRVPKDLAP